MSMQTTAFLYSDVGSNLGEQDQQAVIQLKSRHNRFVQYNLMACLLNKQFQTECDFKIQMYRSNFNIEPSDS